MTQFSFQLYSARNFPPLGPVLTELRQLGYAQVEGYGGIYGDPEGLARQLEAAGLTMPTGHFGLDMLRDTATTLETARTLGVQKLLCPAVPHDQRSKDEAGWKELAATLAELAQVYTGAGLGFGWHNHDFEFVPTAAGSLPMNIILDHVPSLEWEMDVAWLVKGGQSPLAWIDKYADRITAIHVKDIAPEGEAENEDGWADVGHGTMDWPSLYNEITEKTKTQFFVMEHDNPSDVSRFARRSLATAQAWS